MNRGKGITRRLSQAILAGGSALLVLFFVCGDPSGGWLTAVLVAALPLALIALGLAGGRGRPPQGSLRLLVGLALLLVGGLVATLLLARPAVSGSRVWFGGLPASTAVLVYGVGLAALVLTSWAYAALFPRSGLQREDLERLRALSRERYQEDRGTSPDTGEGGG